MKTLVVGGGLCGFAVAGLLIKQGHDVQVVERRERESNQGYALSVWENGQSVLRELEVLKSLKKKGLIIKRFMVYGSKGGKLATISLNHAVGMREPLLIMNRPDLRDELRKCISSRQVRFGISVERVLETANHVDVFFSDRTKGRFDLVIGADGVNSRIRKKLFPRAAIQKTGVTGFLVWINQKKILPELVNQWGGKRYFSLLPHRTSGKLTCYFALPTREVPISISSFQEFLREKFSSFDGPCGKALDLLPSDNTAYFRHDHTSLRSEETHSKRIVLIGDAVHASSPFIGQGASMALEDASVLARLLEKSDGSLDSLTEVFETYSSMREKRTKQVTRETFQTDAMVTLPIVFSPVRNLLMKVFYPLFFGKNMRQFIEDWQSNAPTRN